MTLTQLAPPYPIFTDRDGSPLDAGYLYFGQANQNPETNPIQIYYDRGLTIPVAQPVRTSNGYVMRNGSPALVYADGDFSVTVRNKKSELVIYSPVGFGVVPGVPIAVFDNAANDVAGLLADTGFTYSTGVPNTIQVAAGDILRTLAEGIAYEVAASTATDQHVTTAGGVKLYVLVGECGYDLRAFGAKNDGTADCGVVLQTALSVLPASITPVIAITSGSYLFSTKARITRSVKIAGYGCTIIADVPSSYVFEVENSDPNFLLFSLCGVRIKWGGTFGTNTTGGLRLIGSVSTSICDNEFWGLGGHGVYFEGTSVIARIERNNFSEHLNTASPISSASSSSIYLISIRDNFFVFTGTGKVNPCVKLYRVYNLDVSNNAFEKGAPGLDLCQFGTCYAGRVSLNFFEGGTIGLRLGTDNGTSFFGSFQSIEVSNNIFTSNATHVLIAGSVISGNIQNNSFDGPGSIGINVTSKMSQPINIGNQSWLEDMTVANRITGNIYPNGVSSVDATLVVVDRCDSLTGWTELFDPAGTGTISLAAPIPGGTAVSSLAAQVPAPSNQYIIQKTLGASVDLSTANIFVVPFYVDDPSTLRNTVLGDWGVVRLGPDASNYWDFKIGLWSSNDTISIRKGWNVMYFVRSDATVAAGAPASWAAITYIQLRILPNGTDAMSVRFGGIYGYTVTGALQFSVPQRIGG